jgi:uroporphyrinogen decarboxylase
MNSTERVTNLLLGKPIDRQPLYGWVEANLKDQITERWGSVAAFEDKYEFDMAHIFGGPRVFSKSTLARIREENDGEVPPDVLLESDYNHSVDDPAAWDKVKSRIEHHKKRGRFCYVQTPGFFEDFNKAFGIQNHLMYLLMYPEELAELYARHVEWVKRYAEHCVEAGADMVHISDDWGAQKDLMFSPEIWWEMIYPNMKKVVDHIHSLGVFASLHSDGCVAKIADGIVDIGFDMVHPWQENAGMSHDLYLEKYADKFAILGGICVQSAIGILGREALEKEIRRVFSNLKGKRWICCTSHFVQDHCTVEDLEFAFDLAYRLVRE